MTDRILQVLIRKKLLPGGKPGIFMVDVATRRPLVAVAVSHPNPTGGWKNEPVTRYERSLVISAFRLLYGPKPFEVITETRGAR